MPDGRPLRPQGIDLADRTPADLTVSGKGQHAYEQLRRRILTMELPPGFMLREPEIMPMIGVGRTPLREAIQRLASERLIVAAPRQTPYVAPIHAHELAQIVEMRFVLEVPVARYAAVRATRAERDALLAVARNFRDAVAGGEQARVVEADMRLHHLAAIAARNDYLVESSQRVTGFSGRLWRLSASRSKADLDLQCSHDALIDAIVAGTPDQAAAAAVAHIEFFQARLRRILDAEAMKPFG